MASVVGAVVTVGKSELVLSWGGGGGGVRGVIRADVSQWGN